MTTTDRVLAVVSDFWRERIERDHLTVEADSDLFTDLGFDSLDVAELSCSVEDALEFRMSNADLAKIRTPQNFADLADELKLAKKGRAS